MRGGCLTALLPKQEQCSLSCPIALAVLDREHILHVPQLPGARSCVKLLLVQGRAAPPGVKLLTLSPHLLCGAGGSEAWTCPLFLQCTQTMPSPPRAVFWKGLFASLEEPGSCQVPGAAASLRDYCPFTLSSLPVGGVRLCRRTTAEPLCLS